MNHPVGGVLWTVKKRFLIAGNRTCCTMTANWKTRQQQISSFTVARKEKWQSHGKILFSFYTFSCVVAVAAATLLPIQLLHWDISRRRKLGACWKKSFSSFHYSTVTPKSPFRLFSRLILTILFSVPTFFVRLTLLEPGKLFSEVGATLKWQNFYLFVELVIAGERLGQCRVSSVDTFSSGKNGDVKRWNSPWYRAAVHSGDSELHSKIRKLIAVSHSISSLMMI